MTEFLKKYGFGVVSLLFGFVVSLYFYNKSRFEREPIFFVDSVRTEILNQDMLSEPPIRVLRTTDGSEIKSDLTSLQFYFWNDGRKPIKREDILERLYLQLSDSSSEIIHHRLLKVSRPIVDFELKTQTGFGKNFLSMDFRILEEKDGITGQIFYLGDPSSELIINGTIEGGFIQTEREPNEILGALYFFLTMMSMTALFTFVGFGLPFEKPKGGVRTFLTFVLLPYSILILVTGFGFWMLFQHSIVTPYPSEIVP